MVDVSRFGVNASYVESLRAQWEQDPSSVAEEWRSFFQADHTEPTNGNVNGGNVNGGNGNGARAATMTATTAPSATDVAASKFQSVSDAIVEAKPAAVQRALPSVTTEGEPIVGVAAKIVENMEASLALPTAMSTRSVPVKVLEENRRVINTYLEDDARPRASFTHIIAFALVKAVKAVPSMNHGYGVDENGKPRRIVRDDVNLGLAIDLPARNGGRSLVVPNMKGAQKLDFRAFLEQYNDLIDRARAGKLTAADFAGTTMTLTNPGGIGTVASAPRLMPGQGSIIATGTIGYPAEYEAMAPETIRALGVGKVMTLTSTYDHRIIQGAESGAYLHRVHELLNGEHGFYDELFGAIRIPHHPYRLKRDRAVQGGLLGGGFADTEKAMRVSQLIHAHRVRGHIVANVDPLDLKPREHADLNLEQYGLTIWDLDREFLTLGVSEKPIAPLREILERLRDTYCRKFTVEYMHIADVEARTWMQKRVEQKPDPLSIEDKRQILEKLCQAQGFERFLHKRYLGQKRFSVEGAEAAVVMMTEGLDMVAAYGASEAVIGMAHRGRLNVLANVLGKPLEAIFAEFEDLDAKTVHGSGDVKYHLGARGVHNWRGTVLDAPHGTQSQPPISANAAMIEERAVRVELACNPSHLEAVDPVVLGVSRAKQDMTGDRARKKVVPFLIHGDAAFAGQGVVYEVLQMSGLNGYRVGGTVHLIINNQIGYTTGPERARTSMNCSDVARAIQAPILRVNGDDPEACVRAMRIAVEYRMKFGRDVVIDMVCYRRWGHNEGDEPSFTQPILYRAIDQHEPTHDRYAALLVRRGDLSPEDTKAVDAQVSERLEAAFGAIKSRGREAVPSATSATTQKVPVLVDEDSIDTTIAVDTLKKIAERITYDPEVIEIHPRVKTQILDKRRAMVFEGKPGIDFGMAENLAFGSLLLEGIPVRLSGQDVGRGTFAHRHAVLYDTNDGRPYIPLNFLHKSRDEGEEQWHPSRFRIYDSLLSEEAVLGFEYGYSVSHPDSLVLWEAQFGDFWNGAQVQVDQFIAAGEAKWGQKSRVVMLLPHGYDGQGPEHSSGRVERFLQLCADDPQTGENMRVAIASTPAQYFHLLRRQAKLPKKPLVVFTHKSLLRADDVASQVDELARGHFETVIDDASVPASVKPKRVVFCTGKVYWDIERTRKKLRTSDVKIVRVEQLFPFPAAKVRAIIEACPGAEIAWAQEEPRNMGSWTFVEPRLRALGVEPRYIGRDEAASPATGSHKRHVAEQKAIVDGCLG